ncbi:MAG: protein-L-isoaspartate(D-aspartate) O-methyltransferase [Bacteroidales bacterium]|nr:protein-L-isoaspartate(D-aspartate) O-methyltransferase [Bacteroidales bacterium]MCF8344964.1 protein-L-isoaspartate(D-aspartate) O-methyltransferase [Bacteroidales bacterium]MCF8350572.1 protein-L-isoaspartate(D-aspartate) O-methyltransferase [Bacteroidales bacterium]MCF8377060.1 protein-L-isoaspartate(D-aspartate) O-methyltransferase [Bacteroidales bacterium]MCF8400934.1 protein-L-isoaspartate(D-aspartate) O-methyltransferase [Bacteroidales bacterium]
MNDTYKHKGMRKRLAEEVRRKGIKDERIINAINKIPRHLFMDSSFLEFAYQDKPFPIGSGQTISQPYTVAFQTELLEVKKGDKVLEIGTGSGYQACILEELGAKVFSVERQKQLYLKAEKNLIQIGYNPKVFYGDGYKGMPAFAPYDKILITAAAPYIPDTLLQQLKVGGRLVVPVGKGNLQVMKAIDKTGENDFTETEHGHFRFVPMLNKKAND